MQWLKNVRPVGYGSLSSGRCSKGTLQLFLNTLFCRLRSARLLICLALVHWLLLTWQVVRTRLREPYNPRHGIRYERFFQSLRDIYHYEGVRGLYSGMRWRKEIAWCSFVSVLD